MTSSNSSPVAVLEIKVDGDVKGASELSDPIYGGYANSRGEVVLFGKDLAYRVDFKRQTLQLRPQLNFGAQARYDATEAGDAFNFGNKTFQRLSEQQIADVCKSGFFRVTPRQLPSWLAAAQRSRESLLHTQDATASTLTIHHVASANRREP